MMNIAIIGTRGIPNNYGGFEQFAEHLSIGLVSRGHKVTVYLPHFHPYKKDIYENVRLKHIYSPENWMGSSTGSFFYDFYSLKDALKKEHFDIIYETGYTSIVPAYIWFNVKKIKNPIFVTNMDGLEWKRSKFNGLVQRFIHWEEKKATFCSHYLISDNKGIQSYYQDKYNKKSFFISYGANIYNNYSENYLQKHRLEKHHYYLIIARLEPENNIETIINGYLDSQHKEFPLVIIGKKNTRYAKKILKKYANHKDVIFLGGIYDFEELNSIRHYSSAYFHGHSVGGTNPSLLEAMSSGCFIITCDNIFNRSIVNDNALFFKESSDIKKIIDSEEFKNTNIRNQFVANNLDLILNEYSWGKIIDEYETFFQRILIERNSE